MAKWGEGDPRWIVEERADAKNVNNWHWTEKNATQWSIDTIKELLRDFVAENDDFSCKSLDVTKCDGEAVVNNRKGKLIFFYEWQIEAEWSGKRKTGDNKTDFKGRVEIPNLSEENTVDELDVVVTCTSSSKDGDAIKQFMRTHGAAQIKKQLDKYIQKLKAEYSHDMILPMKGTTKKSNDCTRISSDVSKSISTELKPDNTGLISKHPENLSPCELSYNDEFFCTPADLYKVLTTKELVQAFTRDVAIVDPVADGVYSIFNSNITGIFTSLVPNETIEMRWRKRDWPEGHHSHLTMALKAFEGGTQLKLTQTGVPAYDVENTLNGWQSNFFAALKQTYGYGGKLF